MKFLKRLVITLVLLGLVVFFGVPFLVGTSWAKDHIQTAMAEGTNREVSLGGVSFSWFDGLAVSDVTVHQSQPEFEKEGPLFQLGALKLEVGIRDILAQKINVEEFTIEGPRIVVVRDAEGRFNFDDLMKKPGEEPVPTPEPSAGEPGEMPDVSARLDIREGKVLYIDVPLGTRVEMDDIDTKATWVNGKLNLDMGFLLNGGDVVVKGSMDLSQDPAPFHLEEMVIDEATLGTNLAMLSPFLPLMGTEPKSASGTIKFSLKDLSGKGFTRKELSNSLTAKGGLNLEGGVMASGVINDLVGMLAGKGDTEGLSIKLLGSTFSIQDGKIHTKDMKVETGSFDLALSGWTNLRGKMNYTLSVSRLDAMIDRNPKLKKYLGEDGTVPIKLTGFMDSPKLEFDVAGAVSGAIDIGIEKGLDRLRGDDDEKKKNGGKKKNRKQDATEKEPAAGE